MGQRRASLSPAGPAAEAARTLRTHKHRPSARHGRRPDQDRAGSMIFVPRGDPSIRPPGGGLLGASGPCRRPEGRPTEACHAAVVGRALARQVRPANMRVGVDADIRRPEGLQTELGPTAPTYAHATTSRSSAHCPEKPPELVHPAPPRAGKTERRLGRIDGDGDLRRERIADEADRARRRPGWTWRCSTVRRIRGPSWAAAGRGAPRQARSAGSRCPGARGGGSGRPPSLRTSSRCAARRWPQTAARSGPGPRSGRTANGSAPPRPPLRPRSAAQRNLLPHRPPCARPRTAKPRPHWSAGAGDPPVPGSPRPRLHTSWNGNGQPGADQSGRISLTTPSGAPRPDA